jgi:lipoate---protein ligase
MNGANHSLKIDDYDLPDAYLLTDFSIGLRKMIWIPKEKVLVLGQSNDIHKSILVDKAKADGIRIVRRPTGGESVLLTPQMVIISILFTNINGIQSKKIFQIMCSRLQNALEDLGVEHLQFKGISDLAIEENKILGSSIYRNPDMLFYHAVLNVAEEPEEIARYLHHPQIEPDYRLGRSHDAFVTSLKHEGYSFSVDEILEQLDNYLKDSFI